MNGTSAVKYLDSYEIQSPYRLEPVLLEPGYYWFNEIGEPVGPYDTYEAASKLMLAYFDKLDQIDLELRAKFLR